MSVVEAFGGGNDGGTSAAAAIPALTMTGGGAESVNDVAVIATMQNAGANTINFGTGTTPLLTQQQGPDGNASNITSYAGTRVLTSGDITTGTFNITWSAGARNLSAGCLLRGVTPTGIIKGTPVNANGNVTIPSLSSVPAGADVVVFIIARAGSATAPTISTTDLTTAGYTVQKNAVTAYGATNQFRLVVATKAGVSAGNYGGETITISGISANGVEAYSFALPASGGSALTQTNTDDTGLTDSAVLTHGWGQVNSDLVGLTDNAAFTMDIARLPVDVVGITDSAVLEHGWGQINTDSTGLTDSTVISQGHGRNITDAVGLTDSVIIEHGYVLTIMDSVGISDPNSESPGTIRPVDAVNITDTAILQVLAGGVAGTIMDLINQDLIGRGFNGPGTVLDRERQRLVAATGKDVGYTIDDLYKANGERNRVALESVAIIPA